MPRVATARSLLTGLGQSSNLRSRRAGASHSTHPRQPRSRNGTLLLRRARSPQLQSMATPSAEFVAEIAAIDEAGPSGLGSATTKPEAGAQLPPYSWKTRSPATKRVYLRNPHAANRCLAKLTSGIVGLDMEWKPKFIKGEPENPVALVQLASPSAIYLIHLSAMYSMWKPSSCMDVTD